MEKHKGEILEVAIRKSGYPIVQVAKRIGVTRNTLYNRFRTPDLSDEFIAQVGLAIHYDFAQEFPEIKDILQELEENTALYRRKEEMSNTLRLERKYIQLLERYNRLLMFLIRITNDNELHTVKKEVEKFVDDHFE